MEPRIGRLDQLSPSVPANLQWTDRRRTAARFVLRAGEVKTGAAMAGPIQGEDARILVTWLDTHRPRLIALKGLEDSPYIFPGAALPRPLPGRVLPRGALAPSSFDEMWALGCRHLGVEIPVHRVRHVVATLILAMRPGAYALVASVLGITEDVARRHYGRDSGEAAANMVRQELLVRPPEMMQIANRRYRG